MRVSEPEQEFTQSFHRYERSKQLHLESSQGSSKVATTFLMDHVYRNYHVLKPETLCSLCGRFHGLRHVEFLDVSERHVCSRALDIVSRVASYVSFWMEESSSYFRNCLAS